MPFSPYSTPIKGPEFQAPIPIDLIYQGAKEQHLQALQSSQQITGMLDNLHNLPTPPGAATEIKNRRIDEMAKSLQGLSTQDLSSPNVLAQIHENISKITNDPDFSAAVQQGHELKKLYAQKQELDSKGITLQPWQQKPLDDAMEYIQSGKFIRNKSFSGNLYAPPNIMKVAGDAADKLKASGELVFDSKTGQYTKTEGVTDERLKALYQRTIESTPNAAVDYTNRAKFEHPNYLQEYQAKTRQEADELRSQANYWHSVGRDDKYIDADKKAKIAEQVANNITPDLALKHYSQDLIDADAANFSLIQQWTKSEIPKMDDLHKGAQEIGIHMAEQKLAHEYRLQEDEAKFNYGVQRDQKKAEIKQKLTSGALSLKSTDVINVNHEPVQYGTLLKGLETDGNKEILYNFIKDNPDAFKKDFSIPDINKLTPDDIQFNKDPVQGNTYTIKGANWFSNKNTLSASDAVIEIAAHGLAERGGGSNNTSTSTNNTSSIKTKEDLVKEIESKYKISRNQFLPETKNWIDSTANSQGLK